MFKFTFESTNYKIDDFINRISLESKYINQENISYIKKSFKTLKLTVIDKTNCSEYKDDNDALYFFDIELKTTKYIKEVCKLFVQMFTKINPFLIQFKFNNRWIYFCNSSYLNNKYIDDIIGKKNIYLELDETLKKDFHFNNLTKTSILNLFNDIVYKFIYFYILKIDYDFKRFIPYELLFEYSSINKLKREKSILQNKLKKTYDNQEKININNRIKDLQIEINEIIKLFLEKISK